ncbi:hypothetical protein [Caballeronia sp. INML1]|uniref:hypothetical protein n=1 Tax=Caballeronia sp. INML1 TaxID=2921760 RepID=UPI002029336F|nr:hypothetical protein [Caballeronia sp. INML1]
MFNPLEKALFDALTEITKWPDKGTRYGQQNIKRYARAQLTYAAGLINDVPAKKRRTGQGEPA